MGKMFKNKIDQALLVKYLAQDANKVEIALIEKWLSKSNANKEYLSQFKQLWEESKNAAKYSLIDVNQDWIKVSYRFVENQEIGTKKISQIKNIQFYTLRIAAVLLPLLIVAGIFFISENKNNENTIAVIKYDIKPGTKNAILQLADNSTVELTTNEMKVLSTVDGIKILSNKSTLLYTKESENQPLAIMYNTLTTPLGAEYNLELSDGTKIWLNAGSSIKYPVQFSDSVRKVVLTGEAYFEVAKNLEKPFIVTASNVDVRVLGTSFNVMAYKDEKIIETTLTEGKVQIDVKNGTNLNKLILNPGFQARYLKNEKKIEKLEVNVENYTSWKDGFFAFENSELESIMRELSRWYKIEVQFTNEDLKYYHFTGKLKRYDNISKMLEMISLTTNLEFEIDDNKIIIKKV